VTAGPDSAVVTTRIALITGAGSGIGRACALALLDQGWSVALAGRGVSALLETAELAGEAARRALPVPADIGRPGDVDALFSVVRETFGRLDLLFNNAAQVMPYTPIEDVTYEDWIRVVQTNVTGTFLCSQAAVRLMKTQKPMGGRIINNAAPSAHVPRPDSAAFTATKHAIAGLTRSLSLDGRKYDIACGQIDIGNVTPVGRAQPAVRQADGTFAVEPTMDVRHVAEMIVLMASMPLDANVQYVTVMPTKMPFVGRG
jgi:NAD(P)-dependent dehydrogenase (short-subunit alcohol dehydrogenase family)